MIIYPNHYLNIVGIENLSTQEPLSFSSTLIPSRTLFSGDLLVTSLHDGRSSEGLLAVSSSLELLQSSISDVVYDPSTRIQTFSTSSKGELVLPSNHSCGALLTLQIAIMFIYNLY